MLSNSLNREKVHKPLNNSWVLTRTSSTRRRCYEQLADVNRDLRIGLACSLYTSTTLLLLSRPITEWARRLTLTKFFKELTSCSNSRWRNICRDSESISWWLLLWISFNKMIAKCEISNVSTEVEMIWNFKWSLGNYQLEGHSPRKLNPWSRCTFVDWNNE